MLQLGKCAKDNSKIFLSYNYQNNNINNNQMKMSEFDLKFERIKTYLQTYKQTVKKILALL